MAFSLRLFCNCALSKHRLYQRVLLSELETAICKIAVPKLNFLVTEGQYVDWLRSRLYCVMTSECILCVSVGGVFALYIFLMILTMIKL